MTDASPGLGPAQPGSALLDAVAVMDRLRSPGGCPWDAEQTHTSLAPYAIEEAHEVADAAESGDPAALAEELGDLLLQVLFHARIASEARGSEEGGFDIDDVARGLVAKLRRRHPHVFADADADGGARATLTPSQVNAQWEAIKGDEKRRAHVLDDIPVSLPALVRAQKVASRLRRAGLELPTQTPDEAPAPPADARRIGAALLALTVEADAAGVDAEAALRAATRAVEEQQRIA